MATGRTLSKYVRMYANGKDLSGHSRSIGPLDWSFEVGIDNPLNASVIGNWLGQATISPGTLNALFDNTADSGSYTVLEPTNGTIRTIMIPVGIQAAPAQGDPVFCGQFMQDDFNSTPGDTPAGITVKYSPTASTSTSLVYANPWGILLHPYGAETAANTAVGVDNYPLSSDGSTDGGYMLYEYFSGDGVPPYTGTIKVQHADTNENADFTDLVSTGAINFSTPMGGVVALATTAAVKRYLRWQFTPDSLTTCAFTLAFVRNYHVP